MLKCPIPRKGTKTLLDLDPVFGSHEISYTPQGDGNSSQFSMDSSGDLQNDLHPARGRELHGIGHRDIDAGNTLPPVRGRKLLHITPTLRRAVEKHFTPCKGTETFDPAGTHQPDRRNNPCPDRGRKLLGQRDEAVGVGNTLHLARGRKHILACPFVNLHLKHFTPRQGTETCLPPSRQKSSGETLYTPQGDGNSFSYLISAASSRNTLSPARGRKHLHKLTVFELISKYFTPRKGRKNDWELLNGN